MLREEAGRVVAGNGGRAFLEEMRESFSGLRKRALENISRPQRPWKHNSFEDLWLCRVDRAASHCVGHWPEATRKSRGTREMGAWDPLILERGQHG